MKNNIKFNNSNILYTFTSVNGKYNVELTYDFINQYQLQNISIKISSNGFPYNFKNFKAFFFLSL